MRPVKQKIQKYLAISYPNFYIYLNFFLINNSFDGVEVWYGSLPYKNLNSSLNFACNVTETRQIKTILKDCAWRLYFV